MKMKKRIAWMLCILMALALIPSATAEETESPEEQPAAFDVRMEEPDTFVEHSTDERARSAVKESVTQYSYEVVPLLAPFPYYLYVKTNNPDPRSFRLVDQKSIYFGPDDHGEIGLWEQNNVCSCVECDPGTYYVSPTKYRDVAYENEDKLRVSGGYIFMARNCFSDGGKLVLLERTQKGDTLLDDVFRKTNVEISCPKMLNVVDYLIDTYTDPSAAFFTNLNAVQDALYQIAVYPRSLCDDSAQVEANYPCLASSPYPELSLNEHYEMYPQIRGWLLKESYPFILHSLTFPGLIESVAKKLEPTAEIKQNSAAHWMIDVTFNGETHMYGGAGKGGYDDLYVSRVNKDFTFRGGSGDLGIRPSVQAYADRHAHYAEIVNAYMTEYKDLIEGETFHRTIEETGGTWIRIATEWSIPGALYAYAVPCGKYIIYASDAWVDGRYVNRNEQVVPGESFEDHPEAGLVLHDLTFTDRDGETHTQDVYYRYDSSDGKWKGFQFYELGYYVDSDLPECLILTREQVEESVRSAVNTDHIPESGLVYDGREYPGTPFTSVWATGISLQETMVLHVDSYEDLIGAVLPENASCQYIEAVSSNPDVVECCGGSLLHGLKTGTATVTVTTVDGRYSAKCRVTVRKETDRIASIRFIDSDVYYKGKTPYMLYDEWSFLGFWPQVELTDKEGNIISSSDYTISYRNNYEPGTAYVDIKMKQDGSKVSKMFKILLAPTKSTAVQSVRDGVKVTWEAVLGAKGYVIYRRAWNRQSAGWTTFERWNNTTATSWVDTNVYAGTRYQYGVKAYFAERKNADGTTIGGAMDNYNLGLVGPLKTTVRITTRTLKGLTAGRTAFIASWDTSKLFTGYQIKYSTDANFKNDVKSVWVNNWKTREATVKWLQSGKTYYVCIRSYHIFEGVRYFGEWSNVKSCKVK